MCSAVDAEERCDPFRRAEKAIRSGEEGDLLQNFMWDAGQYRHGWMSPKTMSEGVGQGVRPPPPNDQGPCAGPNRSQPEIQSGFSHLSSALQASMLELNLDERIQLPRDILPQNTLKMKQ